MQSDRKTYRIFLSAAEPSADAHCAGLISSLRKSGYDIEFVGVGGEKMARAGCKLIENTAGGAVMIYKAFTRITYFRRLIKRIAYYLKNNKTDLVIVCDSPAFNFHIAKAAKKLAIKTLFYVAPQLWAWAPWRIRKLRKYCDKLCCILPFEESWFRQKGLDADFVGNPLLDGLETDRDSYKKQYSDFESGRFRIVLMPGSRTAEINSLWLPMQQIAVRLKQKYPDVTFSAVAVDDDRKKTLQSMQIPDFECHYNISSVHETALKSDFTIVASGSAVLQTAAAGCPMVIMYQSSRVLWHLVGRWLITTKYLSLVNILAQKGLVPEFMPYFSSIEPVVESIEAFLSDKSKLVRTSNDMVELVKPLAQKKASEQVANLVIQLLA